MAAARPEQVAALPWRKRRGRLEILLITSRETRRWVIPKGWPMPGLIAFNAAKREAYEEAGIDGAVRRQAIGRYSYDKRAKDGSSQTCVVTVFALGVAREHRAWPERDERRRCWFAIDEAIERVNEAELRAIIRAFAAAGTRAR
jgi:8-oxo-dGTP pyrophosphatase MutT (NUDIX family)